MDEMNQKEVRSQLRRVGSPIKETLPLTSQFKRVLIGTVTCLLVSLPCASLVHAGGLWINEYGSPAMGRAGAGSQSSGMDASAALHNPASMSRLSENQLMVSGGLISSSIEFDLQRTSPLNGNGDGGEAGSIAPAASIFYVRKLSDDWTLGLSFAGLTGAVMEYDDGWAGRFHAEEVELVGLALMPSIAYQLNERVSIGIGVPVMYSDLLMEVAVPTPAGTPEGLATIDGDDIVVSFNLSTLIQFSERSRLGIVYQHEFDISYSGGIEIQPIGAVVDADTEMVLASILRVGFTQEVSDDLTLHLTVGWDDWSAMDEINISTQSGGASLGRNWDDTYHVSGGFDYRLNPTWTVRGGIAYDTNPVDKKDRTADMPIDRQVRYAFGVEYQKRDGLSIGAQLVYADYGKGRIDSMGYGGKYDSNAITFVSVQANWRLGQ